MRPEALRSLAAKRREIGRINTEILALAARRGEIERAFLDELADALGMPGVTLLDSHHTCLGSPVGHCVFRIVTDEKTPDCLFCGGSINR